MKGASDAPGRPRRLTRAQAKARTRELLIDAAAEVFARKGFAGASVEEIAEQAGFSIGALYSNFPGKRELFVALMDERGQQRVREASAILEERPGHGRLRAALGQALVDVADKDMDLAALQAEFWLYAVRHPEVMDTLAGQRRRTAAELEQLINTRLGRDPRGYPTGLSARVAIVVTALFDGLVRQRRIDPASVPPELYADALAWLFSGLAAREAGTADQPDHPSHRAAHGPHEEGHR